MANILWVTKNPPKIFIAAREIAKKPKILELLKIVSVSNIDIRNKCNLNFTNRADKNY